MKFTKWHKAAFAAVIVATSTTAGAAVARIGDAPGAVPSGSARIAEGAGARDLGAGTTQTTYVPVTPCRIVDTRQAGGQIASNVSRTFEVRGTTGFVPQGGKSGGCGVPTAATAVEVAVTAVDTTGGGYMRVFPGGTSEPNATFINYSPYDPTNTGAVTLCKGGCGTGDLSVKGHGSATQVVIDVQGYYTKPLAAYVLGNGSISRSSRAVTSTRVSTGVYTVTFDRDISSCVYNGQTHFTPYHVASTQFLPGDHAKVQVVMQNAGSGLNADIPFYLTVTC